MNKTTFAIGIPTINRADLLIPAIQLYQKNFPSTYLYIIDNGNQAELNGIETDMITLLRLKKNIGVAASWNMLCHLIFKQHGYALILNDDIILKSNYDQVRAIPYEPVSGQEIKEFIYRSAEQWSAFLISKQLYQTIGEFDEKFYPAYFEDNDYEYRIKLSNRFGILTTPILSDGLFRRSMTLKKNSEIIGFGFRDNREYYVKKWGGLPGQEKYLTPFNN